MPQIAISRARIAICFLLMLYAACATAAPRIGVATMQPGEIFFERFGHNAIVVDDPAQSEPLSYNFGFFDMGEDGFIGRFAQGEMMYRLVELPWNEDLQYYRDSGRGVSIQWLRLDDAQAEALAAALAENAKPEHARYRYQYFTDNCATRVRDALDRTFGGVVKQQFTSRSQGNTYRSEAVRLASPAWWMWLGFDLGLGPSADAPMSRWEESYVPRRLADGLRELKLADGKPAVLREETILPHRIASEPKEVRHLWWQWLIAGVAIAVLWSLLAARRTRAAASLALLFWAISGVLGVTMLSIWLATEHTFGWANHNLLLMSPLCVLLLPGAWRVARSRNPRRLFKAVLPLVTASAVLAPFLHWASAVPQANAHWIALLLPIHVAFALRWLRTAATSPTSA